jgi:hypothetical protein
MAVRKVARVPFARVVHIGALLAAFCEQRGVAEHGTWSVDLLALMERLLLWTAATLPGRSTNAKAKTCFND